MALLLYLVNRPGTVVSREELEDEIWKDMVVGYDALNNTIAKLRKAFDDNPKNPKFIHTVPKKGYRLIAEVGVSPLSTEAENLTASGAETHPSLERKLAASGRREVPSEIIGRYLLEELRLVDQVAYVRFASVYRSFQSVDEFFDLLADLGVQEEES